jgi:hypothetical protein
VPWATSDQEKASYNRPLAKNQAAELTKTSAGDSLVLNTNQLTERGMRSGWGMTDSARGAPAGKASGGGNGGGGADTGKK